MLITSAHATVSTETVENTEKMVALNTTAEDELKKLKGFSLPDAATRAHGKVSERAGALLVRCYECYSIKDALKKAGFKWGGSEWAKTFFTAEEVKKSATDCGFSVRF